MAQPGRSGRRAEAAGAFATSSQLDRRAPRPCSSRPAIASSAMPATISCDRRRTASTDAPTVTRVDVAARRRASAPDSAAETRARTVTGRPQRHALAERRSRHAIATSGRARRRSTSSGRPPERASCSSAGSLGLAHVRRRWRRPDRPPSRFDHRLARRRPARAPLVDRRALRRRRLARRRTSAGRSVGRHSHQRRARRTRPLSGTRLQRSFSGRLIIRTIAVCGSQARTTSPRRVR